MKNQTLLEDPSTKISNVSLLQRTFVMIKEETSSQDCEKQLSDPLAIDPLSEGNSQPVNLEIKHEENLDLCENQAKERNMTAFPMVVLPSNLSSEETPLNFLEEDPLSDIPNEAPVRRIPLLVKNELLDKGSKEQDPLADIPNAPQTPRISAIIQEDTLENANVCSESVDSMTPELTQKEPSFHGSEEDEENMSTFPVVLVPKSLYPEELMSAEPQEKDPLADIPDVPVTQGTPVMMEENVNLEPKIPVLLQKETFQTEDEDPAPVIETESSNELHIPVRSDEIIEESGSPILNSPCPSQKPSVSEEEMNMERRVRKSAAVALASIHRSRMVQDEESSISGSDDSSDEYYTESESTDSEGEDNSGSLKRNAHALPLQPATATTMATTTPIAASTSTATAAAPTASQQLKNLVLLQENSSYQKLSHFISDASCDVSKQKMMTTQTSGTIVTVLEKVASQSPSTVMPSLHSTCAKSIFTTSLVTQVVEISQKGKANLQVTILKPLSGPNVKNHIESMDNRVQLGFHNISVPRNPQKSVKDNMITESAQGSTLQSHKLHSWEHKKTVSILKPLSARNVKNHLESLDNSVQLGIHKTQMPRNPQKSVKNNMITESAQGNIPQSHILHSREHNKTSDNFNNRNVNESFKESPSNLRPNTDKQLTGNVISTSRKESAQVAWEIIVHPVTGLLVSKMSYTNDDKNAKAKMAFIYKCLKCSQIYSSEQYEQTHNAPSNAEKQPFACHKCGKMMSLHRDLADHYSLAHSFRKQNVCSVCAKVLSSKRCLKKHMIIHSSERPQVCKICSKAFKDIGSLRSHLNVHIDTYNFTCDICNQSFKRRNALMRHLNVHNGTIPTVKCHICQKVCPRDGLKRHINIVHATERNFQCYVCDKKYVSQVQVNQHIKCVHQGRKPKPYVCEVCGSAKKSISELKDHMNLHSGEKPHTCHVCGKSFGLKNRLYNHLELHKNKFKCDICGYICNRLDNLTTHIRSHTGVKPHKCSLCNKSFTRQDNLQTHKRLVHNILISKSKKD